MLVTISNIYVFIVKLKTYILWLQNIQKEFGR